MAAEEPALYLWKKTWQYSEGNRHKVALYLILSVFANVVNFLQPLVVAYLLNTIQQEGVTHENIARLLLTTLLFVALSIGFWSFHGPMRVIETKNAFLVRANYRKHLVDGVLALPASWHAEHHSGDTIDRIEKGTTGLSRYASNTYEVVETIIRFASSLAALFYFNLTSGFVVLFFVVLAVSIVLHYDKTLRTYWREINLAENATAQKVFDFISNITTVIILRLERTASSQIMQRIMHPFGTFSCFTRTNELKWALVSFSSNAMICGVIAAYLLHALATGTVVLVGTVYALYGYVDRISGLFYRFAYRYSDIVQQKTAVENAEELAKDFVEPQERRQVRMDEWKELRVSHLTFSYDSGGRGKQEHLHLSDMTITIRRGEKIALIGESGSGKTTFLKLLRGLYTPEHATVTVDGREIESFGAISDGISLIPQDPELFTATIRENITMGGTYDQTLVREHTDLACFTSVAERLPRKLDSSIKEKGVNLSGGEKQRLALARGLLVSRGKEIILMDEPTSSVDTKNESRIYQNIFSRHKETTIISTVHRLHLLPMFDTIYWFDKGRIVAHGSLKQLLRTSPRFRALYERTKRKTTK